jgi:predicted nuclease of predicted toxin-antitoxin system
VRFLADENLPRAVVEALVERGHDVKMVREVARGASDQEIVAIAVHDERIIITFDKDFGDLARRRDLPATSGLILLRFVPRDPADAVSLVLGALAARRQWRGRISVIERDRVRVRQLRTARGMGRAHDQPETACQAPARFQVAATGGRRVPSSAAPVAASSLASPA